MADRPALTEVEITDEMIEAGRVALWAWEDTLIGRASPDRQREFVAEVFSAMSTAAAKRNATSVED